MLNAFPGNGKAPGFPQLLLMEEPTAANLLIDWADGRLEVS